MKQHTVYCPLSLVGFQLSDKHFKIKGISSCRTHIGTIRQSSSAAMEFTANKRQDMEKLYFLYLYPKNWTSHCHTKEWHNQTLVFSNQFILFFILQKLTKTVHVLLNSYLHKLHWKCCGLKDQSLCGNTKSWLLYS